MSDLVVIAFPTEAKAEEVRQKLLAMQKEYLIELGDAVIAVKGADGRIKLNQLLNTIDRSDFPDATGWCCSRRCLRRYRRRLDRCWPR